MNLPHRPPPTQEYLRNQIENATPAQQLVMLFDGAIRFTLQAKEAILRGDIAARYGANRRSMEIIGYLLEILDMDKGGEVALRLHRIYTQLMKRMLEIDFKNSPDCCDEVVEHLRTLRAGWSQISDQRPPQATVVAGPGGPADLPPAKRNAVA